MKRIVVPLSFVVLVAAVLATSIAIAGAGSTQDKTHSMSMSGSNTMSGSMPMSMPMPGAETHALENFFGPSMTWTGRVPAGAMDASSQEMPTHGTATIRAMEDGWWYVCDVEDVVGAGRDASAWKGHMVLGYDAGAKRYRAFCADNSGTITAYDGTLNGDTFVLETPEPTTIMGQRMKDRLSWTRHPDGSFSFTDEHKGGTGDWKVFEMATGHAAMAMNQANGGYGQGKTKK